jgi:hypothetical protein
MDSYILRRAGGSFRPCTAPFPQGVILELTFFSMRSVILGLGQFQPVLNRMPRMTTSKLRQAARQGASSDGWSGPARAPGARRPGRAGSIVTRSF